MARIVKTIQLQLNSQLNCNSIQNSSPDREGNSNKHDVQSISALRTHHHSLLLHLLPLQSRCRLLHSLSPRLQISVRRRVNIKTTHSDFQGPTATDRIAQEKHYSSSLLGISRAKLISCST